MVSIWDSSLTTSFFFRDCIVPLHLWKKRNGIGPLALKLKKEIYQNRVLASDIVGQTEILAERILTDLWNDFRCLATDRDYRKANVCKVLPEAAKQQIGEVRKNQPIGSTDLLCRVLCDYLSGMTDRFAIELWNKLHLPERLKTAA
jgi:dGTP triphosphohydrolase